jgi:endo-1,3(4)-beta-glucanase
MYPAVGSKWSMLYDLTSITWDAPRALDSSCSDAVLQGLEYEVGQLDVSKAPIPGDFYYWGGTLAAQGRLALIAFVQAPPRLTKRLIR